VEKVKNNSIKNVSIHKFNVCIVSYFLFSTHAKITHNFRAKQ